MINNRQSGRRRGRGGQRQNIGGQPGNRQDNRQRGNAAQLLEKYKSMARDAQLSGDRVQTEYYLQFADHYFRILSENQRRFEDQRRARGEDLDEDDGDEADIDGDGGEIEASDEADERPVRRERPRREEANGERPAGRPRREGRRNEQSNGGETMPMDALPPAIGRDSKDDGEVSADEKPRAPRRRARSTRSSEGEDGVAPAA